MLNGYSNCCWSFFLIVIGLCLFHGNNTNIWITTSKASISSQPQYYVDALIPVIYDGLGDYIRNSVSSTLPWLKQQQQQSNIPQSITTDTVTETKTTVIRIKKTKESDLIEISSILATASQLTFHQKSNSWQNHIDLLFAKSDIETLIRRRWRIIDLFNKATIQTTKYLLQIQQHQQSQQKQQQNTKYILQQQTESNNKNNQNNLFLKYLWSTNDELRTEIQFAASETGEDTIWNHHYPMIITPYSIQWFNHIQISAITAIPTTTTTKSKNNDIPISSTSSPSSSSSSSSSSNFPFSFNIGKGEKTPKPSSSVVGFCEVAMLSNPLYNQINNNQTIDDTYHNNNIDIDNSHNNDCIISIQDRKNSNQYNYYSPAIANLAIVDTMRRQGIATKLLLHAERYVSMYWTNATTIGLYVSIHNLPAIQLYEKCGYQKIMIISSYNNDNNNNNVDQSTRDNNVSCNDSMWYMSKRLQRRRR